MQFSGGLKWWKALINAAPEQVWNVLISPTETKKIFYGSSIESTFESA
jgi:hypothetical protein